MKSCDPKNLFLASVYADCAETSQLHEILNLKQSGLRSAAVSVEINSVAPVFLRDLSGSTN